MKDRFRFNDGTVLLNVHTSEQCVGQHCVIHNPSQHHMITWPAEWDNDAKQVWRVCPHDLLHPDPDGLTHLRTRSALIRLGLGLHYCDGCCQPPIPAPAQKAIEGGTDGGH
jgi:hypothetical protein